MKAHNTKLPIALREGPDCVVSSSYQVFEVSKKEKLLPKYLLMWMNRAETQRHAGFISFGTTRDIFSLEDMEEISIPIPDISIQQSIVDIFSVYQMRCEINIRLKLRIKDICPILIKGAMEESWNGVIHWAAWTEGVYQKDRLYIHKGIFAGINVYADLSFP